MAAKQDQDSLMDTEPTQDLESDPETYSEDGEKMVNPFEGD
jgi:hypothetical protein